MTCAMNDDQQKDYTIGPGPVPGPLYLPHLPLLCLNECPLDPLPLPARIIEKTLI
jgi:hypothetical protein